MLLYCTTSRCLPWTQIDLHHPYVAIPHTHTHWTLGGRHVGCLQVILGLYSTTACLSSPPQSVPSHSAHSTVSPQTPWCVVVVPGSSPDRTLYLFNFVRFFSYLVPFLICGLRYLIFVRHTLSVCSQKYFSFTQVTVPNHGAARPWKRFNTCFTESHQVLVT